MMIHSGGDGGVDDGRSCSCCCCGGCCLGGDCGDSSHVSLACSAFPLAQYSETLSCFFLCTLDHSFHAQCYSSDYSLYYCCCGDFLSISSRAEAEAEVCRTVPLGGSFVSVI